MRPSAQTAPACAETRAWWLALLAAVAVLITPLFLVDVPPLLDYPNHLSRAWVLAKGSSDPVLSRIYEPHWTIIPNLASDIVLPPLIRVLPVHVAGRILLGALLLMPFFGVVLYSWAVFGRRTWWSLAGCLVAFNGVFILGFLNFLFGVGLALLSAAGWAWLRERRPVVAVALGAACAIALFFSHLMGLVFFLLLVGCQEAERIWESGRAGGVLPMARQALRRGLVAAPVLIGPAVLYLNTALEQKSADIGWTSLRDKVIQVAMPFLNYYAPLDGLAAVLVFGFVAGCLTFRRGAVPLGVGLAMLALTALYLASPFAYKGTSFLDARFPIMFGFLVFAGFLPRLSRQAGLAAGGLFAALFAVRMATLSLVWHAHGADLAQLRQVIAPVEPGDRVLAVALALEQMPEGWDSLRAGRRLSNGERLFPHMAALLLIERRAFWPFFFAFDSQQPVRVLPPYNSITDRTMYMPHLAELTARGDDPKYPDHKPNLERCPDCYDYVLLIGGDMRNPGEINPVDLQLVQAKGFAALYRVRKDPAVAAPAVEALSGKSATTAADSPDGVVDTHG
jgi:hypothetical protein